MISSEAKASIDKLAQWKKGMEAALFAAIAQYAEDGSVGAMHEAIRLKQQLDVIDYAVDHAPQARGEEYVVRC